MRIYRYKNSENDHGKDHLHVHELKAYWYLENIKVIFRSPFLFENIEIRLSADLNEWDVFVKVIKVMGFQQVKNVKEITIERIVRNLINTIDQVWTFASHKW